MYKLIITTTDDKNIAKAISSKIIESNLSPCIQLTENINSIYKWKNKISSTNEFRIEIKSIHSFCNKITNIIKDLHNYEVPEIITTDFDIHSKKYKSWFDTNIQGEK